MSKQPSSAAPEPVEPLLHWLRGERVILDSDLARVYGVPTKRLNEQVRRNADRFPRDFMFRLTAQEVDSLRSQMATSKVSANRSQFATGSQKHRDPRFLPYAFTEHGAFMAANVLNSARAIQMSVFVVRAFLKMRSLLGGTEDLVPQLRELEAKLTARLDGHEAAIVDVLQRLMRLLEPPPPEPEPPRREIGFHTAAEAPPAAKGRRK